MLQYQIESCKNIARTTNSSKCCQFMRSLEDWKSFQSCFFPLVFRSLICQWYSLLRIFFYCFLSLSAVFEKFTTWCMILFSPVWSCQYMFRQVKSSSCLRPQIFSSVGYYPNSVQKVSWKYPDTIWIFWPDGHFQ